MSCPASSASSFDVGRIAFVSPATTGAVTESALSSGAGVGGAGGRTVSADAGAGISTSPAAVRTMTAVESPDGPRSTAMNPVLIATPIATAIRPRNATPAGAKTPRTTERVPIPSEYVQTTG